MQVELVKYLDSSNRAILLQSYNEILVDNTYFDSLNLANIASIFEKGDPSKLENCRPVALLQTFYTLLAAMIKWRLVVVLEPWIHKTQYGFRPRKSTSQAIFLTRRLMDLAERQGTNISLVLLDWEKAFEKIDQKKLKQVLQRLSVRQNIIQVVQNIYREAKFRLTKGEHFSSFRTQDFIMTAIFQDIRATLKTPKQQEPIKGIQFAEMLYADDTLLFGTHTHTINKLLHAVQQESGKYNMKLNMGTCVNLTINHHLLGNKQSQKTFVFCHYSDGDFSKKQSEIFDGKNQQVRSLWGKSLDFFSMGKNPQKVTPLFLVVLTLAFIDVIFAVDSVTAKVSSVHGFDPRAPW